MGAEKTPSRPTVKGDESELSIVLVFNAMLTRYAAKPFKRVKVPNGPAPHFNGDGPADYIPLGGLPPTHLCSACEEIHPMGWCRLKVAGVEHCGLCGLAHTGHGRTCPHLNSEVQVATLLGTLKESTESRELIEQATKYLRMIRGSLVQQKRAQEKKEQEIQPKPQTPGQNHTSGVHLGINGHAEYKPPQTGVNGVQFGQPRYQQPLAEVVNSNPR